MVVCVNQSFSKVGFVVVEIFVVVGEQHLRTHGERLVAFDLHAEQAAVAGSVVDSNLIASRLLGIHAACDVGRHIGGVERSTLHLRICADEFGALNHAEGVVFVVARSDEHTPGLQGEHTIGNDTVDCGSGVEILEIVGHARQHATAIVGRVVGCLHWKCHFAGSAVEAALDGFSHSVEILDFNGVFAQNDLRFVRGTEHTARGVVDLNDGVGERCDFPSLFCRGAADCRLMNHFAGINFLQFGSDFSQVGTLPHLLDHRARHTALLGVEEW